MIDKLRCLTLLCLIAAPSWAYAQQTDSVVPMSGAPINGKLVSMSPTEVVVDRRGSQQKIAVNEIRRVTFGGEPQELRRARGNIIVGQLESGLTDLRRIDAAAIERKEIKQDLQFYLAYAQGRLALSGGGDKNAAAAAMLNFVKENATSFHFYDAAELLGDLAVSLGSHDNAVRYYSALSKAPWPDYKMRAGILEARALLDQGKYQEAQAKFKSVTSMHVDTAEANRQKKLAEIGVATCQAELGQVDEALAALQKIVNENDPGESELFGRTYNAIGRCHLKKQQNKDALLAYLRVDVLFYGEPDVHAEALYHLSKLWAEVKKADRATGARNLLTDRYAGSKWAKME